MGLDKGPRLERKSSSLLSEVEPIEQSGVRVTTREALKEVVEAPLLSACEMLYDKNIQTVMSSANKKDVEIGSAYIDIAFDTLSDENKRVAESLAQPREEEGVRYVHISIPVSSTTTTQEVKDKAEEIANLFKKQPMLWGGSTLEEVKQIFWGRTDVDVGPEAFPDLFYDEKTKLFYWSEEQLKKAKEQ